MIKLIRYHLPPIVKHVLAPQNDFGMPKITWSNHKSFGIEENPPPPRMGKTPKKSRIFFLRGSLRHSHVNGEMNVSAETALQTLLVHFV